MSSGDVHKGPLSKLKVVEFAGLGHAQMCAMLLAYLGATVLRIERTTSVGLGTKRPLRYEVLLRRRDPIALNLKSAPGVSAALEIANESVRQVSLETHHIFGVIGYREEHEATRHFRCVHADVIRHSDLAYSSSHGTRCHCINRNSLEEI